MTKDLSVWGRDCVSEAAHGMETLDLRTLREEVDERVSTDAENVCIYYSDCLDIIQRYEREFGGDADDIGGTYTASQWQEAAQAYAYGIAAAAIRHYADEALTEVEEKAEALAEAIGQTDDTQAPDVSELRVSLQCPHGWAAHDSEDTDGVHYWVSRQLDGCNALAIDAGPFWLSWTWTPAASSGEEAPE